MSLAGQAYIGSCVVSNTGSYEFLLQYVLTAPPGSAIPPAHVPVRPMPGFGQSL